MVKAFKGDDAKKKYIVDGIRCLTDGLNSELDRRGYPRLSREVFVKIDGGKGGYRIEYVIPMNGSLDYPLRKYLCPTREALWKQYPNLIGKHQQEGRFSVQELDGLANKRLAGDGKIILGGACSDKDKKHQLCGKCSANGALKSELCQECRFK